MIPRGKYRNKNVDTGVAEDIDSGYYVVELSNRMAYLTASVFSEINGGKAFRDLVNDAEIANIEFSFFDGGQEWVYLQCNRCLWLLNSCSSSRAYCNFLWNSIKADFLRCQEDTRTKVLFMLLGP